MAKRNCSSDMFLNKDGECCDRCNAGEYMKAPCEGKEKTQCATCEHGSYTATTNHLTKCQTCKTCSLSNNQKIFSPCSAAQDTVCECTTGLYCVDTNCEHCQPLSQCPPGKGVRVQATRTTDVKCDPCKEGTFSNITDFHSPCLPHTRCEDYGRQLKIAGTSKTDAVCGDFKSYCSWMLPAGLWSGLVLTTILIVLILTLWRAKRKSYRAARSSICVTPVAMVPITPIASPELPSHCQETCAIPDCKLPIFNPDDLLVTCSIHDSLDTSLPITPLKATVSFAESSYMNGNAGYCTSNYLRSHSEPQEDEYCGT